MTTETIDVNDLLGETDEGQQNAEYEDEDLAAKPSKSSSGKAAASNKKGGNLKTYLIGGVFGLIILGLGTFQMLRFLGGNTPEQPAAIPESPMVPQPIAQQNPAIVPADLSAGQEGEGDPNQQASAVTPTPAGDPLGQPSPAAAGVQPAVATGITATPTQVATTGTPVPTPVQVAPAVTMSPAPVASANSIADVNKRIDGLESTLKAILVRLDALENGKPKVVNAVSPVNSTPKPRRIVRSPDASAAPVQAKKADIAKVADVEKPLADTTPVAAASPVITKPAEARQSYSVRAVIPGRGWLVNDRGDGLSVAVGDVLPSAGRVTSIDVDRATVTTDQGVVIRSASN